MVGDPAAADTRALLDAAQGPYRPNLVAALLPEVGARAAQVVPLLEGRLPRDGRATAYVCEHFVCRLPVTAPEELSAQLEDRGVGGGQ